MPKGSEELTAARKEEIITACAELYKTISFKEITIKEIGNATSFTRTSIYNYFQTKEEIFLALFQREYETWTEEVGGLMPSGRSDRRREFARALALTLEKRGRLLKLLSTNLNEMEQNSRLEKLVEFKAAYGASIRGVGDCLQRFCPETTEEEREGFVCSFFPFLFGIWPYAAVTEKQRRAMELAGVEYEKKSIYEVACPGVERLLGLHSVGK